MEGTFDIKNKIINARDSVVKAAIREAELDLIGQIERTKDPFKTKYTITGGCQSEEMTNIILNMLKYNNVKCDKITHRNLASTSFSINIELDQYSEPFKTK